jgi:hypothetical protein
MTKRKRGVDALKRAVAHTVLAALEARLKAGAKVEALACCVLETAQGVAVTVEDRDVISEKLRELDRSYRSTEATHAIVELGKGPLPGMMLTVIRTLDGEWWTGQTAVPPRDGPGGS